MAPKRAASGAAGSKKGTAARGATGGGSKGGSKKNLERVRSPKRPAEDRPRHDEDEQQQQRVKRRRRAPQEEVELQPVEHPSHGKVCFKIAQWQVDVLARIASHRIVDQQQRLQLACRRLRRGVTSSAATASIQYLFRVPNASVVLVAYFHPFTAWGLVHLPVSTADGHWPSRCPCS